MSGLLYKTYDNKFTCNGKESEDDHNFNRYYYGAKYYDPQMSRWWAIDPIDEFKITTISEEWDLFTNPDNT